MQELEVPRKQEAVRVADKLYHQEPGWVTFFRQVLGVNGVVRQLFPAPDELTAFEQTKEYGQIQQMVAKLRERNSSQPEHKETTRVITVRLPSSMHETLRTEAHEKKTSMNQLCISKLLQYVDLELIPTD